MTYLIHSSKNFRHYPLVEQDAESWVEVTKILYAISMRIGLSDPLEDFELVELCRFLKKEFPDVNKDILMEAFDLYCAQKLDFTKASYNKLSNLFLSNVLNSFKRYQTEVRRMARTAKEKKSQQSLVDYFEKLLFEPYDRYLNGAEYPWDDQKEWLIYTGLNKLGFPFATAKRKNEILAEVKSKMAFKKGVSVDKMKERIKSQAMRECFRDWVNWMLERKYDIRSYFKEKLEKIDLENTKTTNHERRNN